MIESYALVPHVVCYFTRYDGLSSTAKLVAIELHHNQIMNQERLLSSKNELAVLLHMSVSQVAKALKELTLAGFYTPAEKKDVTGFLSMKPIEKKSPEPQPEPQAQAPAAEKTSHEPQQLDIEDAIAQRQQTSEKKKVPLPVHLCDGKYTLLGSETKLNKESLAVLEEVLKRDEPVRNPNDPIPPTLAKYCNKMMLKMNDHGILQGNQIRFAYWRLKETPLPELMQGFMDVHMRELDEALKALC